MTPVAQEIITSIEKWDHMELNGFGTVEEVIESRDEHTGCKKIIAVHVTCAVGDQHLEYITK